MFPRERYCIWWFGHCCTQLKRRLLSKHWAYGVIRYRGRQKTPPRPKGHLDKNMLRAASDLYPAETPFEGLDALIVPERGPPSSIHALSATSSTEVESPAHAKDRVQLSDIAPPRGLPG